MTCGFQGIEARLQGLGRDECLPSEETGGNRKRQRDQFKHEASEFWCDKLEPFPFRWNRNGAPDSCFCHAFFTRTGIPTSLENALNQRQTTDLSGVMAGLVPAIHAFGVASRVDARHKAGHDG